MSKVLLIDNYDSFTHNLAHYLEALDCKVKIIRNDELNTDLINKYKKIIISPGPGLPDEAGQLKTFIREYSSTKSILGICLGQQAIAEVFGGNLIPLDHVSHGVSDYITHLNNDSIYKDIPSDFQVGLYHSWQTKNLPNNLVPTAISKKKIIMSIKHIKYDIRAVQYHPESIMTPFGKQILKNWLDN
jgi:anthranilate synthase component 2